MNDFDNNGSISNPNRDKLSYKLHKSNSGFTNSIVMNNKNKSARDISLIDLGENFNNYINAKKNNNNYIQLRKFNEQNKFMFYLPNLNKESTFNINNFKKKLKLNVDHNKIVQRNNYNAFNFNNNFNSTNKYYFSPMNKKMIKSNSGFFLKTPMNSSVYNLNKNFNTNLKDSGEFDNSNNNNLYGTYLKKKFSNFSRKVFGKRKKSSRK